MTRIETYARRAFHSSAVAVSVADRRLIQDTYVWRAVDADRMVLAILVQERRHRDAAETFLRRVVAASSDEPHGAVTDKRALRTGPPVRVWPPGS